MEEFKNMLSPQYADIANMFSMSSPYATMPTLENASDLMNTNMSGLSNVWLTMKKKTITQSMVLLVVNVVLNMLEDSLELDDDSISQQLLEVFKLQMQDSVQRTTFN